jgi:2C-methyl-D-erythritol 2,4-cyclodiphosphate synthase
MLSKLARVGRGGDQTSVWGGEEVSLGGVQVPREEGRAQ